MQANKDQDWTDDAAFWDDAWADMNTRLDEKPDRRKGGLAWWPFYLGVAAVFVLVMGAGMAFDQNEVDVTPTPTSVQASAPVSPAVISGDKKVIAAALSGAEVSVGEEELKAAETTTLRKKLDQPQTTVATAQRLVTSLPKVATAQRDFTPLPNAAATQRSFAPPMNISSPASPTKNHASRKPRSGGGAKTAPSEEYTTERLTANIQVAPLGIPQLEITPETTLPTVPQKRRRYPNPLTLEAGISSDLGLGHPGSLVGIGYRITGGKKLSFPLSLRYRFDEMEVRDSPFEEAVAADISTGSPTVEASDLVLATRSLSITSVEVTAGLAWDATPRFRLNAGLGASYQLQALVNFEGQRSSSIFNQFGLAANDDFSLRLDRGEALLSTLTIDGSSPDVAPWIFRARLGAAYAITPRWEVNLKATRLLTQPDRAGVIGLRAGRLELGVSYRLR